METHTAESKAPVYAGWTTFKNEIIDKLSQALPNRIDKSIFLGQAGGVQSQLIAGLKFLALIDEDGKPTQALVDLTDDDETKRKSALASILKSRYAPLFALGLDKATLQQIMDTLGTAYGISGDTKEKAIRFFLAAAQYAGVSLSPFLLKENGKPQTPRRTAAARRPRPTDGARQENSPPPLVDPPSSPPAGSGEERIVKLASGGTLTLTASVGFMKLPKADREFVFGLVDQLDEYEAKHAKTAVNADADDD